jgi:hypothetical protein
MKLKNAYNNAKTQLCDKNSFLDSKKDVYLIITEIGKNAKRHWIFDKNQEDFIEKQSPINLRNRR